MKKVLTNILCLFIPLKKFRGKIRDYFLNVNFLKKLQLNQETLKNKNYSIFLRCNKELQLNRLTIKNPYETSTLNVKINQLINGFWK